MLYIYPCLPVIILQTTNNLTQNILIQVVGCGLVLACLILLANCCGSAEAEKKGPKVNPLTWIRIGCIRFQITGKTTGYP